MQGIAKLFRIIKKHVVEYLILLFRRTEGGPYMSAKIASLSRYLTTPRPGYAFAITAPWGTGKSHFWEHSGHQHLAAGMKPVRISCAGLSSLEDLERALLAELIGVPDAVKEVATIAGKALLRIVHVDPKDIRLAPEVRASKHVVVLDDVERFSGDLKVLFGFVINLLDGSGIHVVLLVDEERAASRWPKGFPAYRERVIGISVPLVADIESFAWDTVNGFSSRPHREVLAEYLPLILDRMRAANIVNLRTVRVVCERLKDVVSSIDLDGPKPRLPHLLLASLFWVLVSRERHAWLAAVRSQFLKGDFALALAMHEAGLSGSNDSDEGNDDRADEDGGESVGELKTAIRALKHFHFWGDCFEWRASPAFVRLMDGLVVDGDELAREFQLANSDRTLDPLERLTRPLLLPEVELRACIDSVLEEIETGKAKSISRIQRGAELLFYLSDLGLTSEGEEVLGEKLAKAVRLYPIAALNDLEPYAFLDATDSIPLQRLRVQIEELRRSAEQGRSESLGRAARSYWYEGKGEDPGKNYFLLFPEEEVDRIVRLIAEAPDTSIALRVMAVLRERLSISNAKDFVGADARGALRVAEKLSEVPNAVRRPVPPTQAARRLLQRMISRYASHVGPGPSD